MTDCFAEILSLISLPHLKLHKAWEDVTLMRHEHLSEVTIQAFLQYLQNWPSDILPIIPTILTTLGNFLHEIHSNPAAQDHKRLLEILELLDAMLRHYMLAGQELVKFIRIIDIIITQLGLDEGFSTIARTSIYSELVEYVKDIQGRELQRGEVIELLQFLAKSMCVEEEVQI